MSEEQGAFKSPSFSPDEVLQLPEDPGVYKYFNKEKELIYVGKAKNIKKRVASYFTKSLGVNRKTLRMVSEIKTIEFTLVNSEFDALLLENNLIKKFQPKYNILLRDDKTYPYICVTREPFPRIFATRKMIKSQGFYYGPFASVRAMNAVLELIRKLYTIRTCSLLLSKENIRNQKFKVCLEYHIGNCQGPCEGKQEESDYLSDIEQAQHILKGNLSLPREYFKVRMQQAAADLAFEKAQFFKEKLEMLENFQSKSLVVNPKIDEVDVFTIVSDEKTAFVNFLKIKEGTINITKTVEVKKRLEESEEEILSLAIVELRDRFGSLTKEIITNIPVSFDTDQIECYVPKIGDKKKLIELSLKNARFFQVEKYKQQASVQDRNVRVLARLQADLSLKELPDHIECFDNSNLQGTNPVASMVCFKNGRPSKKDYRKFSIKTVVGPDDFASMHEIVTRRYKRVMEENEPLPKLIVIDGGKGQLNAAVQALKEIGVYGKVPIIGIAKRLEEIYFPGDQYPLHIEKKSEALRLVQHIRDEAHRFAITFHRQKRSKAAITTALDGIEGIGTKTKDILLAHFGSTRAVFEASIEELSALVGEKRAHILKNVGK